MADPLTLITKSAQIRDDIQKSVIGILEETLEQAKRGDITSVCIIVEHTNHHWSAPHSGSLDMGRTIGRLEMLKAAWVRKYLEEPDA